jgi:hypothetical protein
VARRATPLHALSVQALDALWLCIARVSPMAKPKAGLSPLKNENIHSGGSRFDIHYYRLAVDASRILLGAGWRQ